MFDELIDILDQLHSLYERLLVHAGQERAVLLRADLPGLQCLNVEKQDLAARVERLEAERRKVVTRLAAQLPGRPNTVAGLAAADPARAGRLQRCAARLKETANRLQAANQAGMDLIGHGLKVVQGTLKLLGLHSRPSIYARSGNAPARYNGRILSAEA